ncbi:LysR substrate-binding domain-containing protein [Okibacterium endophyticum]
MARRHFNLEWLESFLAVVEHEGFTNAGLILHRTQSRVSAHIAALEHQLGARLFDRRSNPAALTEEGRAFVPRAQRVLHELEAGSADVAAIGGHAVGRLKIGSFPSASAMLLAPLISGYGRTFPDVEIELHEGPARWMEEALAKNRVEVAIRAVEPEPVRSLLRHVPIFREPLLLIARPDDGVHTGAADLLTRLGTAPIITIGEPVYEEYIGYEYRNVLQHSLAENMRRMVVSQPATLVALVRAGVGMGLIGRLAAEMVGTTGLVTHQLDDGRGRSIGLFWNGTNRLSHVARLFVHEFHAHARSDHLVPLDWDPTTVT